MTLFAGNARGVKRAYFTIYVVAFCIVIVSGLFSYNAFTEVGAIIVIIALFRGVLPLSRALSSAEKLEDWREAAQSGQSVSLRQDIYAGVVGTFLGGFSRLLYLALEYVISLF